MRRQASLGFVAAFCALAQACPNAVPEFRLEATGNQTFTQKSLVERPTVLVFLKADCPANPKGAELLNQVQARYPSQVRVLGIVRGEKSTAERERTRIGLKVPVLADPTGILFDAFAPKRSLDFSVVATKTEPRWAKLWSGIGRTELSEALELIRRHGHSIPPLDPSWLPDRTVTGCPF